MDAALTAGRLYLTARDVVPAYAVEFEARLADVILSPAKRTALVDEWEQRVNNTGRMNAARAVAEGTRMRAYAAAHPKHVRAFIEAWLEVRRGGSEECDNRLKVLKRALVRAL